MQTQRYGYLFVHFVEAPDGDGENVFFSLSDGDDPTRWTRLCHGAPVLTSDVGTTGIRDPYLVRGGGEFFIVATDLRVWGGTGNWEQWQRSGSRSIVVWRSTDLVRWSTPWLAEVAPPAAGMAWAPEADFDAETGEYLVYWSSALYDEADPDHLSNGYSRILAARTRDFRTFSPAETLIDRGTAVIDACVYRHGNAVVRFAKNDDSVLDSLKVFQEVGSSFFANDFRVVASGIGDERFPHVEGPLIFKANDRDLWYLLVDQYSRNPMGYIAYTTTDPLSGEWTPLGEDQFRLPPNTKHGSVLPLISDEWHRLKAAFSQREWTNSTVG